MEKVRSCEIEIIYWHNIVPWTIYDFVIFNTVKEIRTGAFLWNLANFWEHQFWGTLRKAAYDVANVCTPWCQHLLSKKREYYVASDLTTLI